MKVVQPVKKAGRSWVKMLAYPYTRSASDISGSMKGIAAAWDESVEVRRQKAEDAKAVNEYLGDKSAKEKFAEIFAANNWTESELSNQAVAARRTRLGSLFMIPVLVVPCFWLMMTSPIWLSIILGVVIMVLTAAFGAQATRFAWWEAQIEERACFSMREFLGRQDLIPRILRLRSR